MTKWPVHNKNLEQHDKRKTTRRNRHLDYFFSFLFIFYIKTKGARVIKARACCLVVDRVYLICQVGVKADQEEIAGEVVFTQAVLLLHRRLTLENVSISIINSSSISV